MKLSLKSLLPARDLGWNRVRALCSLPDCHNKLLTKYVPGSPAGLFVGEQWYCSPDCFALGINSTLAVLSSGSVIEMPRNPRLSLGLALLSKGYLTDDQYRSALVHSQRCGEPLESTLMECGFITEKQLAAGRATQWGCPALAQELSGSIVEIDLPVALFRALRAAPLHYSAKTKRLLLGFVDRVEHSLLQAIETITGCRAEPCFISPAEFSEQIERLTALPDYREAFVEDLGTPLQMGRALGGWAVEMGAREASVAKCGSYLWARITGRRGTVDVVFSLKPAFAASRAKFPTRVPEVTMHMG
ncbi:MAG TPA: hypothetical protein VHX20_13135 [Terracidiphilus sp.]|jgi:hypothetical protein|nr:hypothetical protein [Terracidiphilus sp.]